MARILRPCIYCGSTTANRWVNAQSEVECTSARECVIRHDPHGLLADHPDWESYPSLVTAAWREAASWQRRQRRYPVALACPCECNSGGFCGGCGHAGCSGGVNLASPARR